MKRVELLSPAGDFESLKSAIHNGADAVYLSGKNYGARKFANNFTLEELKEAIEYAHLYGVKIYITVNTMIYQSEIDELLEYVKCIHEYGVDAVIMQDIGMINLVHNTFPNLEIHASTQAHNHNDEGINTLKKLGCTRVVLDRELSLDEIKNINVDVEKEIFIHGALCVSYSGECLFSSLVLNRSGNRGECAGLCRLPYELLENDKYIETEYKYLLSMKELNTTEYIKEILDANVDSLKIEGRMKSPEYVGFVTRMYRKLIDNYYDNKDVKLTNEDIDKLKVLYNREFTKGFLNNEDKTNIVNPKTPNHQGIEIGEVIETHPKIKIKLSKELNQGDGIRLPNNEGLIANFIYNEKDLLINKGNKNEVIYLDNKFNLTKCGKVLKTLDSALIKELQNYELKKISIDFKVFAKVNNELMIKINDGENEITETSIILDKAINKSTTKEEIIEKLNKLGNTPFRINNIEIDMDNNVFIPIKEINNLRRILTEKLESLRKSNKKKVIINNYKDKPIKQNITNEISFLVRNEEQLKYLLDKNVIIYTEDYLLYKKYKNEKVYFKTIRVSNKLIPLNNGNVLASELGSASLYSIDNNVTSEVYLNIANTESLKVLANLRVNKIGLSIELNDKDLIDLTNKEKDESCLFNKELYIYGRPELMIMKYCVLSSTLNGDSRSCGLCHNKKYYLEAQNKEKYPVINYSCLVKLLHSKNIDLINNIDFYKRLGITNFRIDLYDEDIEQINSILKRMKL